MHVLVLPPNQTISKDHYSRGRNLCKWIHNAGADVTALTRHEPETPLSGVDVITTGADSSLQHFTSVKNTLSEISNEYDIIQVHVPHNHVSGTLFADIDAPLVFGPQEAGHDIDYQHFKTVLLEKLIGTDLPTPLAKLAYKIAMSGKAAIQPLRDYAFQQTLTQGDHITAVTSTTSEFYTRIVETPVSHIPLGVRLDTFEYEPTARPNTFVCFGHLTSRKNFSTAIKAIAQMNEDATLNIIGAGPQRETLEQTAREYGVTDNVHFLGYVDEETLIEEVQTATATIHPSTSEGYFHAQLESLAAGTPLVSSNLDLCTDIHSDADLAQTCSPHDVTCFAQTLDSICTGSHQFNREKCRTFVEENYNWESIGYEYLNLYTDLLE